MRNKEVKAALFDKNDALSMADELRTALQDMETDCAPKHEEVVRTGSN
ncbi:hypothetical protein ACFX58_16415 [Sphingomonas sp. NCPPB 2930]